MSWAVVLPQTEPVLMSEFPVTFKDCVYVWHLGPHLGPCESSKATLLLVYADLSYFHCHLGHNIVQDWSVVRVRVWIHDPTIVMLCVAVHGFCYL